MKSEKSMESRCEKKKGKEPKVVIRGKEFRLDESQTGKFGVTKVELQGILLMLIRKTKDTKLSQRGLFSRLLDHMKISNDDENQEELLKIYLGNLQELRDAGKVEFVSGKTRINLRLVNA